jgi:glycosyltransferase involved in cell wall biosynthesis
MTMGTLVLDTDVDWFESARSCPRPQRDLSVVIPFKDEAENLEPLYRELKGVLDALRLDYEVLFVDDGSTDGGLAVLQRVTAGDARVAIIELRRNFGQTAAMAAGIDRSRGRILIPMDADMQNDPRDISALLARLDEPPGYDVVSGWRRNRQDKLWTRRVPSQLANRLIGRVTRVPIHDFGCTMKAYRREVLEGNALYSELHRFLPALASWHGARIAEIEVNHRPRTRGVTKYGLRRTFKVLLDLVTVKFLGTYIAKPLYFFGKLALWSFALSLVMIAVAMAQRFGHLGQPHGLHLNRNIFVVFWVILLFFSVQCVLFGVIAELLVRIYHETRGRPTYHIRTIRRQGVSI